MAGSRRSAAMGRWACAVFFLSSGFVIGSWAPQIPELGARLGITESVIGLIVLAVGIGALSGLALAGALVVRLGSRPVTLFCGVAIAPALFFVTMAPNLLSVFVVAFYLGFFNGGLDVAMNANTVTVERQLGRPVMSSMHGFWSLGGLAGGALGGPLIVWAGPPGHAIIVGILCALLAGSAIRHLPDDGDGESADTGVARQFAMPRALPIYLLGLLALLSMEPEGAVLDWSALYLRQEVGAGIALSGMGFAAFSLAMMVMRFAGDGIRARFGSLKIFKISAVVAGAGLVMAGMSAAPGPAILGFLIAGLGVANLVPIAFSAAANHPGIPPAIGLTVVTSFGYSGLLVVPALIGFIAERTGLSVIYMGMAGVLVVVLLMSRYVVHADASLLADAETVQEKSHAAT